MRVPGPTVGKSSARAAGKKSTSLMPSWAKWRRNCSSTISAIVPTTIKRWLPSGASGKSGTMLVKHWSSPWVKVVSMPEPLNAEIRSRLLCSPCSRAAALARSSLITSEGHEPTRNKRRMSGLRSSNSETTRSNSS